MVVLLRGFNSTGMNLGVPVLAYESIVYVQHVAAVIQCFGPTAAGRRGVLVYLQDEIRRQRTTVYPVGIADVSQDLTDVGGGECF